MLQALIGHRITIILYLTSFDILFKDEFEFLEEARSSEL